MKTIYKYPLEVTDENQIEMPVGAEILCVQVQHGIPCIWAKVETDNPSTYTTILTYGTGHPVNPNAAYIGTYQMVNGDLVFHVFSL